MKKLVSDVRSAWIPVPKVPLIEWLPANVRLPAEDSDDASWYKIENVPYFWGVMYALDNDQCWMVVLMKAAQIGWTVLLAGWVSYVACNDPSRILGLFPKDQKVREFMDDKLVPLVESSPAVGKVIDVSSARKVGNRTDTKNFSGGFVKGVGSNSVANVKSTSTRRGFVEEPDDTNQSIGDQGDAIRLFRVRMARKRNKKLIVGGTPAVADLSQVEHYTKLGTQRVLPVTCHHCGNSHVLDWDNVVWEAKAGGTEHPIYGYNLPATALYYCPECKEPWDDYQRHQNIKNTCNLASESGDPFCGWVKTNCGDDYGMTDAEPVESFQDLSELYVCMPGTTLADVVREFLEAEHEASTGDESARIVFQNSKLGRPYRYAADQILDHEKLEDAADDYPEMVCPAGGLLVRSGVDVQHDRVAIIIRAWGKSEESWLLFWGEIDGDTADKKDPVWEALDKLLFSPIEHDRFGQIYLSGVTIDSSDGSTNNAVYHWVRTRSKKYKQVKILAGKGDSNDFGTKEIYTAPRKLDLTDKKRNPTKADRHGVKVYMIGTHKAKDIIMKRLLGTSAYMHSCKHVRGDYWRGVTSEVKAPSKRHRGKMVYQLRPSVRNEPLDCEVYALHNAHSGGMHKMTDARWDHLEAELSQRTLFDNDKNPDQKVPATKPKQKPRNNLGAKSGWGSRL